MAFGNATGQGFVNPAEIITHEVVIEGDNGELLVYNGDAAAGNLIYSIAAVNATDSFGNAILGGGAASYLPVSIGTSLATLNVANGIEFYEGPANGTGPWTESASFQQVSAGALSATFSQLSLNGILYLAPSGDVTGATDLLLINGGLAIGAPVILLPGTFHTDGSINITVDGSVLKGQGLRTAVQPIAGANFDVITNSSPGSNGRQRCEIRDFAIDGSLMSGVTANEGNLIHVMAFRYGVIQDIYALTAYPNWAIILDEDSGSNISYNNVVRRIHANNGAAGIYAKSTEADEIEDCLFQYAEANVTAAQGGSTAAYMLWSPSGAMDIHGNVFGSLGTYTTEAVRLENGAGSRVTHNRFDTCQYGGVHTTAGPNVIANNVFVDCGSAGTGVPVVLLGSGGNAVNNNVFQHLNAVKYTYGVAEPSAQAGNVVTGNSIAEGTDGYINMNAASTNYVTADNGIGNSWNYVGTAGQPAFAADWGNAGGGNAHLAFRNVNGDNIQVTGVISPAAGAAATIFTLPAGFIPNTDQPILGANRTTAAAVDYLITSAGTVEIIAAGGGVLTGDTYDINGTFSLSI